MDQRKCCHTKYENIHVRKKHMCKFKRILKQFLLPMTIDKKRDFRL